MALLLAACAADDLSPEPEGELGEPLAVVGGKNAAACSWPSTVDVNGCTGTLIHPRVVTTAAHCLRGASARVSFTAGRGMAGAFTLTGRCRAGARGATGGGTSRDWAYCVLPDDPRVQRMPITPPLVGCEAQKYLKPGASAWVVGFGTTGPRGQGAGQKREVEVKINRVANGVVNAGDRYVGACHGDSGGPLYMKIVDGGRDFGWRVVGSTSSAGEPRCDCTCSTAFVDIAMHVRAIETNEGIDVTPCTDAQGRWAPTEACKDFPSTPNLGSGTYPACSIALTREKIESCGPNTVTQAAPAAPASVADDAGAAATL